MCGRHRGAIVVGLFFVLLADCRPLSAQTDGPVPDPAEALEPASSLKQLKAQIPFIKAEDFEAQRLKGVDELSKLNDELNACYKADDFAGMDAIVQRYRDQPYTLVWGKSALAHVYGWLGSLAPDQTGEQHEAWLNQWIAARPNSATPRVLLADRYIEWAWDARGSGFAGSVSEEGWKLFHERLERAEAFLAQAEKLEHPDAELFATRITIAQGLSQDREIVDAAIAAGIKLDPSYYPLYERAAAYLLPRWHGSPGDVEKFAEDLKTQIGEDLGAEMYLRVAFTVQPYEGWQFFEHTSFDFEKILQGWLAFSRRYKSHVEYQNRIGYIAYLQRDRALARRLTAALNDEQFREDVWGSEQAVTRFKAWVNTVMEARGAMRMFAADKVPLRCLVFSRNGKRLVVFGNVNYDAAFVWDIESSRLVRRMPAPPEPSRTNAISVDRRIAVWGGGDATEDSTKLAVYRLSNGEVRATSSALTDGVRGLALTRKVDRLAVLQADRVITLWDPWEPEEEFASIELFDPALDATWIEKAKADPEQFHCHALTFSGDDKKLLAVVQDREVRVFDVEAETLVQRWCEAHGTPAQAESLDRSPDGRFIAISYEAQPPRPVDLIDAKTLEPLLQLKHESSVIYGLAFDDQGERIAIGGVGDGVTIWSTGTGEKLHGIPMAPTDTVTCLAFSPDGNTLAAGVAAHDKDGTVYIFDVSAYRAKAP